MVASASIREQFHGGVATLAASLQQARAPCTSYSKISSVYIDSQAAASAATAEKVVDVVAGKGCLKRSDNGPSGGSSGAVLKKVTFSFVEKEESGETLIVAKVSRRGHQQKRVETGSPGEGVAGVVCANAQVIGSMTNAINLCPESSVEKHDNLAEVVGAIVHQKHRIHEDPKRIAASAQAGVSRRSTRKLISSTTADTRVRNQNAAAEKEGEVIGGAGHTKLKKKTTTTLKVGETLPVASVSGSTSSVEVVTGQVGADVRETRSKGNAGNLFADSRVESLNILGEAEENGEVVPKAVDSKRNQKTRQNAKNSAANARAGISRRITRSSGLSADGVLLCPIVEKQRWRRAAELGVDKKSAEVQDLPTAASHVIIEGKRSQSKEEYCKLAVQKSTKVAVYARVTGSCSTNSAAALPDVIDNKSRMKTETLYLDRVAPAVSKSDVPRNNSPITTRSLRNRALQNSNIVLEEAHAGKKLEKKRQPRRPGIGRCHQFSSSVEEEKEAAAPCKSPQLPENASGEELQSGQREDVGK